MDRSTLPLLAILALLIGVGATTLAGAAGQAPGVPRPDLVPSLDSDGAVLAYAGLDSRGRTRIYAAHPVDAPAVRLGPAAAGNDGPPTITRTPDHELLVMASRQRRAARGAALWSQLHDGHEWKPARVLPATMPENLHPSLATGGGETWAVWLAGDGTGELSIQTARWLGDGWSAPELVPGPRSRPMVPVIAVDPEGRPAVAFSALDGRHAQIWLAQRTATGWSSPRRLTDAPVHDVTPDLAFQEDRPVLAWARFAPDGYRVHAGEIDRLGRFASGRVSRRPGHAPRVLTTQGLARIVWSAHAEGDPNVTMIRTAWRQSGSWSDEATLAPALNARVGTAGDGTRWVTAWHRLGGITVAEVIVGPDGPRVQALRGNLDSPPRGPTRGASRAAIDPELPGTWLGFGDSITAGLVRFDGAISFVEGYPAHLGRILSEFLGASVIVNERAVPGEFTLEGLARLRDIMRREFFHYVLLNEGANDLGNKMDPAVVVDNLVEMVATVRSHDGFPVLSTVLPRREQDWEGTANGLIDQVNDMLESRSRQIGLLVDMHAPFDRNADAFSDHIHPDADGYELMAETWFGGLLPVLHALLQEQDITDAIDADALLDETAERPSGRQ